MTMMTDNSIGIDISKDFLDAHRLIDGAAARFQNSPSQVDKVRKPAGEF